MTWKTLESAIALAANIAKDYLSFRTSDSTEKKQLENDIEQNPAQYNDTTFSQEVNDGNKEFNNEAFTNLENDIKENPENFVNHESEAIAKEAADLLDDDKRNDEISEDMYVKLRQEENREWANSLIAQYNKQAQYEMPEDLFDDLTEEDVEWASQMIDDLVFGKKGKTKTDPDWIEQAQADDAYAMGVEENNYLPPEEFKQVGAFLGGAPADVEDVEYTIRDDEPEEPQMDEETVEETVDETQVEEPKAEEDEATTSRRNNFLDKLRKSISMSPANGSFTAEETSTDAATGGAIGKGIGSNINGQAGGVGANANLGGSPEKEQELKEYKEQRNIDQELHYDDVPVEQMSSVSNPGANNGNTGDVENSIKVPNAHSSFSVKKNELKGKTGHAYGPNKVELDEVGDDNNDLEEMLKTLDDYSMFEPLIIENVNDQILVDGNPLKMASEETLKYIEEKLNG